MLNRRSFILVWCLFPFSFLRVALAFTPAVVTLHGPNASLASLTSDKEIEPAVHLHAGFSYAGDMRTESAS